MNLELVIAVVYLACATLLFIIAFLIYQEDQRKRINRITALMFGFAGFGPFSMAWGNLVAHTVLTRSALYNSVYVWELFFPQLVFFALCFPTETRFYHRFPRLKYIIFVPHVFHLLLTTVLANPDKLVKMIDPREMGTLGKAIFGPLEQVAMVVGTLFSMLSGQSHQAIFDCQFRLCDRCRDHPVSGHQARYCAPIAQTGCRRDLRHHLRTRPVCRRPSFFPIWA